MIRAFLLFMPICLICSIVTAQEETTTEEQETELWSIHGELKAHYRWSEDSQFPISFPFPPDFIPRGQTSIVARTVSPGSSLEVSVGTIFVDLRSGDGITGRIKVNFGDLYNRNPTSTDQTVNLKEAWISLGRRSEFLQSSAASPIYVLFGKAPKFERQSERNSESYGLVFTAFNRFEDLQLQVGGNVGSHFYWRAQLSNGNPVFFRDVNALAGDNGNDDFRFPNPEIHLNSGFPILYDAEIEDISTRKMEGGVGLGVRFESESQERGLDVLGFYYRRELADRVDLRGTFYGGDLDLLDGTGGIGLPITDDEKMEFGANVDFHAGGLHVFFQGIHQEVAGLERNGYETEIAWRFGLPPKFATSGKQLLTFVQPVFRFSALENDFGPVPLFVAPSTFWDWKKYDFGVRVGIIQGVDVTAEYTVNDITASRPVNIDEFLSTLRFRF